MRRSARPPIPTSLAIIGGRRDGHGSPKRLSAVDPGGQTQPTQRAHPLESTDPPNCGEHQGLGFGAPVLVDETFTLIAGEGRWKAAELLGIEEIPAVQLLGLSEAQKRALALADNKIGDNAGWDRERLAIELPELAELLIEDESGYLVTGFSPAEIDQLQIDFEEDSEDPDDEIDQGWQTGPLVSERGCLWILDQHRLLCGDARSEADLGSPHRLRPSRDGLPDVPYNVRVRSVSGRGRTKHPEFAFASGEMSRPEYVEFLVSALGNCNRVSRDGAVQYVCCDWRHVTEIIEAGRLTYGEVLNIVIWVKSNAGQGSFYRSQHEFIVVFRVGRSPHLNNIQLGRHGRSRSNVWTYRGVNTFGSRTDGRAAVASDRQAGCSCR